MFADDVVCFCSNAAAHARQRLSDVDKLKPRDAAAAAAADKHVLVDDEVSSAVMRTTLSVLLRYQRLLLSRFIATDKLHAIDLTGL